LYLFIIEILVAGACIVATFSALVLLVCRLLKEDVPNVFVLRDTDMTFDYVIVGAGTGGSTLAALLTKHSNGSVLLIEAGGPFGLLSRIPLLTTFQQKGINDWSFLSVPQKHSAKGLIERRQTLPRGKGLGGSANLNFMLHFDDFGPDFDSWCQLYNLSNWCWQNMRSFMAAAKPKPVDLYEITRRYSALTQALDDAREEFGHKSWKFRSSVYNIRNGLRHSVYHQFLLPVLSSDNLRLLPHALVKRINLSQEPALRASSVVVGLKDEHSKETLFTINVRRELLLCAGAYQSPQLLLASGIGESSRLARMQIPLQHHLPLVGGGLHDHFNLPLFVSIGVVGPTLNQRALLSPANLFHYLSSGTGAFGNFGVLGHISGSEESAAPFGITFFGAGAIDESTLMSISNFKREAFRALFPRYHNATQEGFVVISSCLQPSSRGTVTLQHRSMRRNPLINPNYLSELEDISCTIAAIRNAVKVAYLAITSCGYFNLSVFFFKVVTSSAFAALQPRIHWPKLQECQNFGPFERDFVEQQPSDLYLECLMRHVGLGSHHPGGTCALGRVVDSHLRLHGVPNLRIVDASVLPRPVSGNPNTAIAAIAFRAASWILKDELRDGTGH
ncbi:hypothetical protein KR222_005957, partial [Zaprionus bogoriensis]